jgi:hypothetical protein
MNEDLTTALVQFALAVLALATTFVTVYLTPKVKTWLAAEEQKAIAAGHANHVETGKQLAQSAVLWAEQQFAGAKGEAKREAAAAWLYKLANERGIDLPKSDADKLVEEAVRLMNAAGLDVPTKPKRTTRRKPATEPVDTAAA